MIYDLEGSTPTTPVPSGAVLFGAASNTADAPCLYSAADVVASAAGVGTYVVSPSGDTSGITDTAALNAARAAIVSGSGSGMIFLAAGTWYLNSVLYAPGIVYVGLGAVTLKKVVSADTYSRMFRPISYSTAYATDTAPVEWHNLKFDGQSSLHGPYSAYQFEQAAQIFLSAAGTQPGRLRAKVRNCEFINCVSDAVSVYTNVDLDLDGLRAHECFRGSLVITGGYSIVRARNVWGTGDTDLSRIDIEIDGAGYGGALYSDVEIDGAYAQNGIDLAMVGGGRFRGSRLRTDRGMTTLYADGASTDYLISDSDIAFGVADGSNNRIVCAGQIKLRNCDLRFVRPASASGVQTFANQLFWAGGATNARVSFERCRWSLDASVNGSDTTIAVQAMANAVASGHVVSVTDCVVEPGFDEGIHPRGGTTRIRNSRIDAVKPWSLEYYDGNAILEIDDIEIGSTATVWGHVQSATAGQVIRIRNCVADEAVTQITRDFGTMTESYQGGRLLLGASAPTTSNLGLIGDVWQLKTPAAGASYRWVCTGYSGANCVWKLQDALAA